MKNYAIFFGFALGAAAGAAAGLLLAPRCGRDTRRAVGDFVKGHCPCKKNKKAEADTDEVGEELVPVE